MNKSKITYGTGKVPMRCESCREEGINQRASYLCSEKHLDADTLSEKGHYLCEDCLENYGSLHRFAEVWMINEPVVATGEWKELLLVHPA